MKSIKLRVMAQVLPFLLVTPGLALAQTAPTRGEAAAAVKAAPGPTAAQPAATQYSRQQIDQMIAPIALYPDELLAQVLMAATYPQQLIEAAKWLDDKNNAELKEAALVAALEPLPWDPSVKALLAFPQVVVLTTEHIEWTQTLGVAFATQQALVMSRVQALRQLAVKSGKIDKVKQVSVRREGPSIVIVSAQPDRMFVPVYNPTVVYGAWQEREYPPVYLPPPRRFAEARGFVVETVEPGFEVIGVPVVRPLWGWTRPDWRAGRITINTVEYTRITRTVQPPPANGWRHEGPVVLVAPAAAPRPIAPVAVAVPVGTVAPLAAAAVVVLPQRAQAQPNLIRAAPVAATAQPSPAQPAPAPAATAPPSPAQPAPAPAATAQPSTTPPAQAPAAAAKPGTTQPSTTAAQPSAPQPAQPAAAAAKPSTTEPATTQGAAPSTAPKQGTAENDKAKPPGVSVRERQTGQKEPATTPAATAETPATAPAAERLREHGQAGAAGKPAEPVTKAPPEHAGAKPAAAPPPTQERAGAAPPSAPERAGAGAPAPHAPEQATAKPPAPAQTGAAVPPGHVGQRPAATPESAQGSSVPPAKPGPAAAGPAQRAHEAVKGRAPGQPEAGDKKE